MNGIRLAVETFDSKQKVWTFGSSCADGCIDVIDVGKWCGDHFTTLARNFHILKKSPGEAVLQIRAIECGALACEASLLLA